MQYILQDYALYVDGCVAEKVMPAAPLAWLEDLLSDDYYVDSLVTQADIESFKKLFAY